MSQLTLYSTEGCHLCEMAHSLLLELGGNFYQARSSSKLAIASALTIQSEIITQSTITTPLTSVTATNVEANDLLAIDIKIVDIAFDECLFERYGVTIPVLEYQTATLNWPFNLQELQDWLENNGITYHT